MIRNAYLQISQRKKLRSGKIRNDTFFSICLRICTIMSVHTLLETYFSIDRLQPTIEYTPEVGAV
jgi:hypothetical protein